jgi:hypothetical protein
MWRSFTHRAVAVFPFFYCILIAGCREQAGSPSAGVSLTIQMTGLLLMVPPKSSGGVTHVLAPQMWEHYNLVGFHSPQNTPGLCAMYNDDRDICYVKMDGWMLDSIGAITSGYTDRQSLPAGVLNLTHLSGGDQVDLGRAMRESRSVIRLYSGKVTKICSLAYWRYDPVGQPRPKRRRLANRVDWRIPNLNSDSLVLVFRGLNDTTRHAVTLKPNARRQIELLVVHVPVTDTNGLFSAPGKQAMIDPEDDLKPHFNAFYGLMNPAARTQRPVPDRPWRFRRVCPITILDLSRDTKSEVHPGTRTQSCITASADGA